MIRFLCPHCNKRCKVPADAAGRQAMCPKCGNSLMVPNQGVPVELPPLEVSKWLGKAPPVQAPRREKECVSCGKLVAEGAKACKHCGNNPDENVSHVMAKPSFPPCPQPLASYQQEMPAAAYIDSSDAVPKRDVGEHLDRESEFHRPGVLIQTRKHSGLGIAAFLIALLIGGLDLIVAIISATAMVGRTQVEAQAIGTAGGIALLFLHYLSLPLCVLGAGLGLVALIAHRNRNNLFSWIGLCGNGLVIVSILAMHVFDAIERTYALHQQEERIRLQAKALRLEEEARYREEEARRKVVEAHQKELDKARGKELALQRALNEHIAQAKHALNANHVDAAQKEIALAEKYTANDVRITELKTELNFRRLVNDGDEFLAKEAFEKSLASFQAALKVRPKEATVQNTASAIIQIQKANLHLQHAKQFLRDEKLEDACEKGKQAANSVLAFANEAGNDKRFQATVRNLTNGTVRGLLDISQSLRTASQADMESGGIALSDEKFSAAIKEFDRAGNRLATAKTFLVILNGNLFSADSAEIGKVARELETEIAAVDLNRKAVEGRILLQAGKGFLKEGREHVDGAVKECTAPLKLDHQKGFLKA
jgi:hypothetical protein